MPFGEKAISSLKKCLSVPRPVSYHLAIKNPLIGSISRIDGPTMTISSRKIGNVVKLGLVPCRRVNSPLYNGKAKVE